MLARVWSPCEAVSIWQELVNGRKLEISLPEASNSNSLNSIVAANLSINVDQLSEWDASARAWLQAADSVDLTTIKQKQLMLIVENVNIPVDTAANTYNSVLKAWITALTTMDCVIGGSAYSIREGSVLVALSAWHLYPNLIVLGNETKEVKQGDPLVNISGVITIGLEGVDHGSAKGVSWSLPLASLRYYGDPIVASRSVNSTSGRFSISEFQHVVLGSTLACWGLKWNQLTEGLELIQLLWSCFDNGRHELGLTEKGPPLLDYSWIKLLSVCAQDFLASQKELRDVKKRAIALGFRKPTLLGRGISYPLGLRKPLDLIGLLKPESFAFAINYLEDIIAASTLR